MSAKAPFGGATRQTFDMASSHPLASKMQKAYLRIEHDPKMDNRNVRKRNLKEVATLMEGTHLAFTSFNLAELYYNGAPGIPSDWNRTLDFYVKVLEAVDAAQTFAGDGFAGHFVFNLVGIIDSMEMEGLSPVAARLEAACALPYCREWPNEFELVATFGRARLLYLQSKRADAAEEYKAISKMGDDLKHSPMLLQYVEKAKYQLAKMQNFLANGGDEGGEAVEAQYTQALERLHSLHPEFQAEHISNEEHKEPDRIVGQLQMKAGATDAEIAETMEKVRAEAAAMGLDCEINVNEDVKSCANGCGKQAYTEGKNRGRAFQLTACGGCGDVVYCSKACQKAHWPQHKAYCRSRRAVT